MSCSNCYNGCVETISDKCVRYTGENVPILAIETGDTLLSVEQILIDKIISFLDGTGINITVNPSAYCILVTKYLAPCFPECGTPTIVDLFTALVKAACDLQSQVNVINTALIPPTYDVDCLSGVTSSSTTAQVLQAVITKLCEFGVDLEALALDVDTNYVKLADLNSLIAAYLASQTGSTQQYVKMVPYTMMQYFGPLSYFDSTGAGFEAQGWDKVYLCNGLNGTPDMRGRVPVGAIALVPGGALDPAVSPAYPDNPNYGLGDATGDNTIALSTSQLPIHTHSTTVNTVVTDPGHFTDIKVGVSDYTEWDDNSTNAGRPITRVENVQGTGSILSTATTTQKAYTDIEVETTVSVGNTGSGNGHRNIQPVRACYYIMYIP
jgi:microcystin-dependent protein